MEQNANNRLLNEEELEKVGGGFSGLEFSTDPETGALIVTEPWFTCIHCGSHSCYVEPVKRCTGCGRDFWDCVDSVSRYD